MSTDAVFAPLNPRGTVLGDEVYAALGEAILDGRLRPGQQLRDGDLAVALGVSRTPVREALQRLERSGLVEIVPGRYTRVTAPDEARRAAAHEFLVYTMGNAVRMAMSRCTDAEHAALLDDVDGLIAASEAGDNTALFEASARFFTTVVGAAHNAAMKKVLDEAEFALRRDLHGWRPHEADPPLRTELYRRFRDAVVARDGDTAEQALRRQNGYV